TYSDTTVAASTCYDYRVSAINAVGTGAASTKATETSNAPATVPDQVTGLTATAVASQIDLSWTAPGDGGSAITGYKIERQLCTG
ncbi:fibronectin type III domain-containing protein, partial [Shewanella sp. C32]